MSATYNFSRRFFAEFIASRVQAWGLVPVGSRPTGRIPSSKYDDEANRAKADTNRSSAPDDLNGSHPGANPTR